MATITGYTAARMQAIEDGSVTNGSYDSTGHLILTKHDGSQIDAGRTTIATTAQAGIVTLATSAETQTGTDASKVVTPAGLASLPGVRVQIPLSNTVSESAGLGSYANGESLMALTTGSGWSLNGGLGFVMTTTNNNTDRGQQLFYSSAGGTQTQKVWLRTWHSSNGGGGWTTWQQIMLMANLTASGFTQATAMASYPAGQSRLYYTTSTSSTWDFTGMAGEVITYSDGVSFARQTFTQHVSGSTNTPEVWMRTSDNTTGWSAWKKLVHDPGSYTTWTPTWSTSTGLHLPSFGNATASFKAHKLGKNVHVTFDVTFGSTTNFGASVTQSDNWTFSLPAAWPANGSAPGTFLGIGDMYKDATNLGFTRIKLSGTTAISFGILTCFVAGALGGGIGGDVDSLTPWTWASGNAIRGSFDYETTA